MSTEIRKIVSTDILPIIYNYLNQIGLDSVAKKLLKKSGLDLDNSESPLAEKKIQKIIKFYITNHKHMIQKFLVKQEESESESESEEEQKVKSKKSKKEEKLNKKRKASKKDSSDEDDEEEKNDSGNETPIVKKTKKNGKAADSDDDEPVITKESIPELEEEEELLPGERKYFQKCDDRKLKYLKPQQQDYTHEAKKRFGTVGDEFGNIGNEQLKDTRGKSFRKGKDKLKNKNFCGGDAGINIYQINSIPL